VGALLLPDQRRRLRVKQRVFFQAVFVCDLLALLGGRGGGGGEGGEGEDEGKEVKGRGKNVSRKW
jgi:hypothetical protein